MNDVTSAYACLCLWGPRARDVLQPLTKTPLDFPYMPSREISVGNVPVHRVARHVRRRARLGALLPDRVRRCGSGTRSSPEATSTPGGYRAIDALRLEKGYRAWGSDLNAGDDARTRPASAFAVKRDKGDFIGRDALDASRQQKLVCLVLDDPRSIALGSEPVRAADGEIVGRVTSGGYGYAVGASIALRVRPARARRAGHAASRSTSSATGCDAEVRAEPLYDPKGERIRA